MATQKPTKPLFTARFTLVNTKYYTANDAMSLFGDALKKAGYTVYQTPAVKGYEAKYTLAKEGPFEGDDSGAIYETMTIKGPDGKDIAIAKDIVNDPKGSSPILEQRKPMVTAFAWNIGPPANAKPADLAALLWAIKKASVTNAKTMAGTGWVPIVDTWEKTPVKRAPYPNRPAIPQILLPIPVDPKPVVKPVIKPVYPITPPLPPTPPPEPSFFSDWRLWLGLGILGAWVYFRRDEG